MGTAEIQGNLWGSRANDWADYGEGTSDDLFDYLAGKLGNGDGKKLLDLGCGAGKFCKISGKNGFIPTGLDASENLIKIAKGQMPGYEFIKGDIEKLPFSDGLFDITCAVNSFQYAESFQQALSEAKRVTKKDGSIIVVIWDSPEKCDASAIFKALSPFMPPPPFHNDKKPLFADGVLEEMFSNTGIKYISSENVECAWKFENEETALRAILSAGVIQLAINNAGIGRVTESIRNAIKPFKELNGKFLLNNYFKCIIGKA